MAHQDKYKKLDEVQEIFSFYRGCILDLFEQELGTSKNWQFIRGRLLKLLSQERGLEAKIAEIFEHRGSK